MRAVLKKNAFLRFIIFSSITYLLFFLVYQFIVKAHSNYDQKFIGLIINSSDWVLQSIGYKTFSRLQDLDFQIIGIDGSHGVWVGSNCNAISLFILFSVFVVFYPGHQKAKWWFIPFGLISIHFLNIIRVVCLAIIANSNPTWLNFNHTYTFTFLVYAYIFMLWVWWVNSFANKKPANNEN